jgi:hypothetical protein
MERGLGTIVVFLRQLARRLATAFITTLHQVAHSTATLGTTLETKMQVAALGLFALQLP